MEEERLLRNTEWVYSECEGSKYRSTEVNGKVITQKRVMYAENSKRRLGLKALQGEYSLLDMQVKGTGNTFLIIGWETVPVVVNELSNT